MTMSDTLQQVLQTLAFDLSNEQSYNIHFDLSDDRYPKFTITSITATQGQRYMTTSTIDVQSTKILDR